MIVLQECATAQEIKTNTVSEPSVTGIHMHVSRYFLTAFALSWNILWEYDHDSTNCVSMDI